MIDNRTASAIDPHYRSTTRQLATFTPLFVTAA